MITINITEFKGYDNKTLYEFLMLQNQTEFQIKIPKYVEEYEGVNFSVFWEYHLMAYVGHRLCEAAESFAYFVPAVSKGTPYSFDVEIKDFEKFTDTLFEIIEFINDEEATDTSNNFELAASNFFSDAFDDKVQTKTWGLLSLANDYLAEG